MKTVRVIRSASAGPAEETPSTRISGAPRPALDQAAQARPVVVLRHRPRVIGRPRLVKVIIGVQHNRTELAGDLGGQRGLARRAVAVDRHHQRWVARSRLGPEQLRLPAADRCENLLRSGRHNASVPALRFSQLTWSR